LLVVITFRKVRRAVRRRRSLKRGGDLLKGESVFISRDDKSGPSGLAEMLGEGPTPELAAEVAEKRELLPARLGNAQLRTIALLKMEGYKVDEIATKLACTRRSVERRSAWSRARHQLAYNEPAMPAPSIVRVCQTF